MLQSCIAACVFFSFVGRDVPFAAVEAGRPRLEIVFMVSRDRQVREPLPVELEHSRRRHHRDDVLDIRVDLVPDGNAFFIALAAVDADRVRLEVLRVGRRKDRSVACARLPDQA